MHVLGDFTQWLFSGKTIHPGITKTMSMWAVITGGGGGIGAALSIDLSRSGYKVLAVDLNFECLEKLLERSGLVENITKLQGDVSSEDTISGISTAIPTADTIHILAHFAVVCTVSRLLDLTRSQLERAFSVNVVTSLQLVQTLLPRLTAGKARVLHIDTLVDHYPEVGFLCYGVTKAAHYKMGQQLKLELSDTPIKVGSVYPGLVRTGGMSRNAEAKKRAGTYTEKSEEFLVHMKAKRTFFEPEESARFLKYLLLDTADEEFVKVDWRADDEKHWPAWREN